MVHIDILIPTINRPEALALTLTSLAFQDYPDFRVIISDQSENSHTDIHPILKTPLRLLHHHGHDVTVHRHPVRRGMAEQREFLRLRSGAPLILFLDDDIVLEPFALSLMQRIITKQSCGFTGMPPIGLQYETDIRPEEERIERWKGKVRPESVKPGQPAWNRYLLHNAANMLHVQIRLKATVSQPFIYKVAWIGGCVLYDAKKLDQTGGFSFYDKLPTNHCGEDVLSELRLMKRFGGCGVLPSGAYHQELPTTITDRSVNAPEILPG